MAFSETSERLPAPAPPRRRFPARRPVYWIAANRLAEDLPDADQALAEPDGQLAAGGDLTPERLLDAYRRGIFPWYSDGQPILWWSPDPRCVLRPERLHVARSLRKRLRRGDFEVRCDGDFSAVIRACAAPRPGQLGTWLNEEMIHAYSVLHARGMAHSIECRRDGRLVGGLYGVAIGQVFFGESMFSREPDGSKVALAWLAYNLERWGYRLIDCQIESPHLRRLGAEPMPRARFLQQLEELCRRAPAADAWRVLVAPA